MIPEKPLLAIYCCCCVGGGPHFGGVSGHDVLVDTDGWLRAANHDLACSTGGFPGVLCRLSVLILAAQGTPNTRVGYSEAWSPNSWIVLRAPQRISEWRQPNVHTNCRYSTRPNAVRNCGYAAAGPI